MLRAPSGCCRPRQGRTGVEVRVSAGGASSSGSGSGDAPRRQGWQRKARQPGLFEVEDVSPPRRSLGIHALPPDTHNGDQIEVAGGAYVVQATVVRFRLERGRYRPDHKRLEVASQGRFLYNHFLEALYNESGGGSERAE